MDSLAEGLGEGLDVGLGEWSGIRLTGIRTHVFSKTCRNMFLTLF